MGPRVTASLFLEGGDRPPSVRGGSQGATCPGRRPGLRLQGRGSGAYWSPQGHEPSLGSLLRAHLAGGGAVWGCRASGPNFEVPARPRLGAGGRTGLGTRPPVDFPSLRTGALMAPRPPSHSLGVPGASFGGQAAPAPLRTPGVALSPVAPVPVGQPRLVAPLPSPEGIVSAIGLQPPGRTRPAQPGGR